MVSHFFYMGGYGFYVWPAYSITLLVFGINILTSFIERKNIKKIIMSSKHESQTYQ